MKKNGKRRFVVCVRNRGYVVSLEKKKIHIVIADREAEKHGMLRVIDESGDDYLYPQAFFAEIALPLSLKRALLAA